jgi:heme A synthase
MKKISGLILKIIFVIILFFASLITDEGSRFVGIVAISIFLILILFDTYRIKQYNYKIFYLVYLAILIFQGIILIQGIILLQELAPYSYLQLVPSYMLFFGFILIYIWFIFTFIQIYRLSDKREISSFFQFGKQL